LNLRPAPREDKKPTVSHSLPLENTEDLVQAFKVFLEVDLRKSKRTIVDKVQQIRKFMAWLRKSVYEVSREDIRQYLRDRKPSDYTRKLKTLKLFFRDFLRMPQTVDTFKFKGEPFKPKRIFQKEQLQRFYECLETPKEKALFLIYATSGLRYNEVISLEPENIDFKTRMITPNGHEGETKKSWLSFYNEEAERVLNEYSASKKPSRSERIFPMPRVEEKQLWKSAKEKTSLNITPQRLREWFCCEMAMLGVSDRYIDAFCGRTPKTILARNYTDYSPEKLKLIYEKANLKVFD